MKAKQKKQVVTSDSLFKPPVVAVLGHVDHGKTTLLDTIRKSRIVAGEAGAITQHIGAYQIDHGNRKITFIDTPGHAAFANLRARGANVADIALLVIDAVESVKPQTDESIKIIKKAGIPMIVAMNKIDLPNANPVKVGKDLLRVDVQLEEHGGKIASVPISGKTGKGISDLLDTILLVAELKKITASESDTLQATIIEARKDVGRGNVATVIVRTGTLAVGDKVSVDTQKFHVRALFNDLRKPVKKATPGAPVEVLGFSILPSVGATLTRVGEENKLPQEQQVSTTPVHQTDAILKILLKADTQGSIEALQKQLPKDVAIVAVSAGDITESDIAYAKTTDLVIIGFNVRLSGRVKKLAEDEGVRVRTYRIIYELFDEVAEVAEILKQGPQKKVLGEAKILQEFVTSSGKVAGVQVTEGRIARGDKAVFTRKGEEISESVRITAIREQKEEVTKVEKGTLCGILVSPPIDFRIGDMIQSYTLYEF